MAKLTKAGKKMLIRAAVLIRKAKMMKKKARRLVIKTAIKRRRK